MWMEGEWAFNALVDFPWKVGCPGAGSNGDKDILEV